MSNVPYVIETAVLLLFVFLVGCALGYAARRLFANRPRAVKEPAPLPIPTDTSVPTPSAAPFARSTTSASTAKAPAASGKPAGAPKTTGAKRPAPKKPAPKRTAAKSQAAAAVATSSKKPPVIAAPRAGGKDDLKRVKGIGPTIETKLNALGIFHYDQIAAWDRNAVNWVDENLSFRGRIDREKWIEQAGKLTKK